MRTKFVFGTEQIPGHTDVDQIKNGVFFKYPVNPYPNTYSLGIVLDGVFWFLHAGTQTWTRGESGRVPGPIHYLDNVEIREI